MKKALTSLLLAVPFTVFAADAPKAPAAAPATAKAEAPKADAPKAEEKAKPKVKRPEERKAEVDAKKSTDVKVVEPATKK